MNAVYDQFKIEYQVLKIDNVELSNVKIGDGRLFRAKVLDNEKCKKLLLVASRLKSLKGLESIYVQ